MTVAKPRRTGVAAGALLLLANVSACGLLDVTDPTAIEDEQLNNAAGAALLRGAALAEFYGTWGNEALNTGLYTDEFTMYITGVFGPEFLTTAIDRRDLTHWNNYSFWPEARRDATVAYEKLRQFGPQAQAGEMLALRGYATLRLAATYCPGFPITELAEFSPVMGGPITTEQAYERAIVDFDSALTYVADSARVLNLARVGRAAAFLGLGRFAEAAAAAADVPTSYSWQVRFLSDDFWFNPLVLSYFHVEGDESSVWSIADREGGSGLDFVSADDPRVELRQYGTAAPPAGSGEPAYEPAKYAAAGGSPIDVATGIEARLIEAEAALAEGDAAWLSILNDLRATQVSPSLPPLDDPATPEARLDLLFRERAFWLFATGQRLPDLLRLVRLYGRDPDAVFPTGEYHQHGYLYGTSTTLPFDPALAEPGNFAVTGCTDR